MNSFSQLNLQIPDLWEVKDVINKVKNVVLNYTEMEAKVHEATNNEPWGASSTLMQEIAQGTYNYQYFNEIMPTIYKRFTEKEAKYWRQIYKALVLLEYLVKNGSERVIDDARAHISTIKILRNFHYIDEKGKDQGINIRNRAKELSELINDTDKIRVERKKARQNRNKYTGVGSESSFGMGSGPRSRYGGFGSESLGQASIRFDDSYAESSTSGYYDEAGRHSKYDNFDDLSSAQSDSSPKSQSTKKAETAKDVNLFDFGDDTATSSSAPKTESKVDDDWGDFTAGGVSSGTAANDDFDDFQAAPSAASPSKAPAPATGNGGTTAKDLFDLFGDDALSTPAAPVVPVQSQFSSVGLNNSNGSNPLNSSATSSPITAAAGNNKPAATPDTTKKSDLPSGIWSQASAFVSLDSLGKSNTPAKTSTGPSINSLKSSSVNAGWSAWATSNQAAPAATQAKPPVQSQAQQPKSSSPFDDLLS